MKALIFAAGLGTRLKPLTDTMPKALVPLHGEPLLAHTLRRLIGSGATEAVVNVHHFGEQIIDYLARTDWGIPVGISDERDALLETGGGLRKAAPLFHEPDAPILIHNVDILSNADLGAFYAASAPHDALLLVSDRPTQRYLLFDDDLRLRGWTNLATGEVRSPYPDLDPTRLHRLAFAGIHCFWPARFSIIDFYLKVCAEADIRACVQPGLRLLDVGKVDSLRQAETFLQQA